MYKILDQGIWHWPMSSTPDKGSNTVLLGHRFTYTNPNGVLYHLDKVRVGDNLAVIWSNHKYVYTVQKVQTVVPSMTDVVAPTVNPTLTIYTCTPLWSPHNRLVVTAELEKQP
jgi:sortase A